MIRYLTIFFIFCASLVHAATFEWDYPDGCEATPHIAQFNLYYADTEGDNKYRLNSVLCGQTSMTLPAAMDGYYALTASGIFVESNFSNEIILANYYFNSIKYDYDTKGRILYKGQHTNWDAATSDTNWVITRYYYDSNNRVIDVKIRITSWDNRTTGW